MISKMYTRHKTVKCREFTVKHIMMYKGEYDISYKDCILMWCRFRDARIREFNGNGLQWRLFMGR